MKIGAGSRKIYEFGRFRVDAGERFLYEGGGRGVGDTPPVALTPKAFDTLLALVENPGRVLTKEELMQAVWPGAFVEENNLAQNISILRKTLGAGVIETIPKRGYRFAAPVRLIEPETTADPPPPQPSQQQPPLVIHEKIRARVLIEEESEQPPPPPPSESGRIEESLFDEARRSAAALLSQSSAPSLHHQTAAAGVQSAPETHYAQSGDVNIAYQVIGAGDLDIVFVMGWVSHLEYFWKEPHFAAFLNRLAGFSRLILFDKRGTGLSDRVPLHELPTLEQRMDDVRCVMEAVDSKRAVLIGVSEGGPMCSLFAATYPEKTTALVMIGTYAKRIKDEDYPWGVSPDEREAFFDVMRRDWGKPVGIEERAPTLAGDEDFRQWWATYLRMGASPGAAVALTKMNAEIDVRHVLPTIRVPTLVIHRQGDMCLKVEEGRFVAARIPGCKYVELGGVDHLPFVGNQDEILDEIEEFLTGVRHAEEYDRVLATVMCVRIVDPQAHALEITNWDDLMERSGVYVRRQIELFKGQEISFDENGLLATFDGPARAIRCALAITDSARRLNIRVKTGLHTGECDVLRSGGGSGGSGRRLGGVAVELAEKIAAEAAPLGEVLVSRTVKDLVAGSGIHFAEYGEQTFAGINGRWRLFSVER
jgi:pimeloyl-ACP methyl ester carboxylesterase/DNA-binding winged helix-turn-helix (wHTH) protein/class 3 adenylate cyclase